jgi:hypothetical protein
MIACGSYTGNFSGSNAPQFINLGWEAQYVIVKKVNSTGNWGIADALRGMYNVAGEGTFNALKADVTAAEDAGLYGFTADANGFGVSGSNYNNTSDTYIYMAIRAPMMKEPEAGTEVFGFGGTLVNSSSTLTTSFVTDMFMQNAATSSASTNSRVCTRLLGANKKLLTSSTASEAADNGDSQYGGGDQFVIAGAGGGIVYAFKRAKGFFDVVAYTGNGTAGHTVNHSLGVVPEMIWVKNRNSTYSGRVYSKTLGKDRYLALFSASGSAGISVLDTGTWNSTSPTDLVFSAGSWSQTNRSAYTYIAYLFATLDGVSKVGSYTGNGTNQNIACGFSAGARFVLIKRTDATGDWYIWDTTRGIVTGNDPHLSLNTTSAQVTSDDSIDPQSAGFTVNQVSATNINVTSATYIFMAIA